MTGKICYTIERCVRGRSLAGTTKYAPVAQLDRALDSDSKGRWFESSRAYQMNELRFSRKCSKNGVLLIRKDLSIRAFFDDWRHAQQKSLKCRMIMFTQGRYLNTVFVRHFAKASAFMALRRWMRMAASAPKASLLPRKSISSAWSRRVMSDSNSWCSLSMMVSDTALWMMGKS